MTCEVALMRAGMRHPAYPKHEHGRVDATAIDGRYGWEK